MLWCIPSLSICSGCPIVKQLAWVNPNPCWVTIITIFQAQNVLPFDIYTLLFASYVAHLDTHAHRSLQLLPPNSSDPRKPIPYIAPAKCQQQSHHEQHHPQQHNGVFRHGLSHIEKQLTKISYHTHASFVYTLQGFFGCRRSTGC